MVKAEKESSANSSNIAAILEKRFMDNQGRHKGIAWEKVASRLNKKNLGTLLSMELTGGEPDVIGYDKGFDKFIFCDCSPESPAGRRSLCYDKAALDSRKEAKPAGSVLGMCAEMGVELLSEDMYKKLQSTGDYDTKTSSWLLTPVDIREKGGAIFGDKRYGHVFIYHNGADSYYGARGFRGVLYV